MDLPIIYSISAIDYSLLLFILPKDFFIFKSFILILAYLRDRKGLDSKPLLLLLPDPLTDIPEDSRTGFPNG